MSNQAAPNPLRWGESRSKTVTWHDPLVTAAQGASLSGLDYVNAIIEGALPPPPIAQLFGMRLISAEPGRAEFHCDPDESAYNPLGIVHGGLVCTLLDSVVGCAAHTSLPKGVGYTSIELKVNYLRQVHSDSGPLKAVGVLTKPGRRVAFADGTVEDRHGKLVATASGSLLVFELGDS